MIGWITGKLGSAAMPYVLGGVAVVMLGLVATIGALKWQISGLETDVAEARQETAEARTELTACQADSRELESAIENQNERIQRLKEERDIASAAAAMRGVRVLVRERERDLPDGHGPLVMNEWLGEVLHE